MEGQMQVIFVETLNNTGEENLWQENSCEYNRICKWVNEKWHTFIAVRFKYQYALSGWVEEVGLQVFVFIII